MSIDDVEAAAEHQAKQRSDAAPTTPPAAHARSGSTGNAQRGARVQHATEPQQAPPSPRNDINPEREEETEELDGAEEPREETQEGTVIFTTETADLDVPASPPHPEQRSRRRRSPPPPPRELKPLPNQRFRKKNAATEWEAVLQKRLTGEVKERELEILATSVSNEDVARKGHLIPVEIGAIDSAVDETGGMTNATSEESWSSVQRKRSVEFLNEKSKVGSVRMRTTTPAWLDAVEGSVSTANPAYSYAAEVDDSAVISMTAAASGKDRRQPKVRKTIAMFENINRDHIIPEQGYAKRGASPGRAISPGRGTSPGRGISPTRAVSPGRHAGASSPGRGLSPTGRQTSPVRSPSPSSRVIQAGIRIAGSGSLVPQSRSSASPASQRRVTRRDLTPTRRDLTPHGSRSDVVSSHSTIVKVDSGDTSIKNDTEVYTIVNKIGNESYLNSADDEPSVTVVEIARL